MAVRVKQSHVAISSLLQEKSLGVSVEKEESLAFSQTLLSAKSSSSLGDAACKVIFSKPERLFFKGHDRLSINRSESIISDRLSTCKKH